MKVEAYKYYKELPPWAKGVVVVGGAVALFFVGKKLYSIVFPSAEAKRNAELTRNIDTEIARLQKTQKATFPDSSYNTLANTIYNSMRFAVGDDYGAVQDSLKKMKNDLDVAKLIKAFGTRQDYAFGIPVGDKMDLLTYVKKELGNEYFGLTSYRVTNINKDWAAKKISYTI
jgi:hypothetical protein